MRRASILVGAGSHSLSEVKAGSLAWALSAITLLIAALALGIAATSAISSGVYRSFLSHQTLTPFITAGFAVVGALVASRHPRNPIGWIFVTVGLLYALSALGSAISFMDRPLPRLSRGRSGLAPGYGSRLPPAGDVCAAAVSRRQAAFPRWRIVAWCAALGLAMYVLSVMVHPGPLPSLGLEVNPVGSQGAAPILDRLMPLGSWLLAAGIIGSLAAFFVRFRRSVGVEREQMKWLVYAMGVYLVSIRLEFDRLVHLARHSHGSRKSALP